MAARGYALKKVALRSTCSTDISIWDEIMVPFDPLDSGEMYKLHREKIGGIRSIPNSSKVVAIRMLKEIRSWGLPRQFSRYPLKRFALILSGL